MNFKLNYTKIFGHASVLMIVVYLVFLIINYSSKSKLASFWNLDYILYLNLIIVTIYFLFVINKIPVSVREDSRLIYTFEHIFLLSLIVLIINQFFPREIISDYMSQIMGFSIASGILTFYAYINKVNNEIDKEIKSEEKAEQSRLKEFEEHFPRINKIMGLRKIVKWVYKEGWAYILIFLIITAFGIWLRLRYLDHLSLWFDESASLLLVKQILAGKGQITLGGVIDNRAYVYHHYLALLIKLFPKINILNLSRLANLPFFLISNTVIYFFGKELINKKIGLLSSFLFVTSAISISMFREIRFYEMFTALFILISYILFIILKRINYSFPNYFEFKRIFLLTLLLFVFFILGLDTQPLAGFIFYPLILFGFLLAVVEKKYKFGLVLALASFILLVIGVIYKSWVSFKLFYIIKYPLIDWKISPPNRPLFEFFNLILLNEYFYLSILIVVSILFILKRKQISEKFLFAFPIALYMIIANQGYETSYIRYYYFIVPSLVLFIAVFIYRFAKTISHKERKINILIGFVIAVCIFAFHINSALTESNSAITKNSVNIIKNVDSLNAFDKIKLVNKSRVIVDRQMSLPFYIYFGVLPANIAIDSKMVQKSTDSTNSYLNISEMDYTQIFDQNYVPDADYLIFSYMITEISEDTIKEINKNSEWVYNNRFIYIYKLKNLPPNNSSYKIQ